MYNANFREEKEDRDEGNGFHRLLERHLQVNLGVGLYMHWEEASFGEEAELKGLEMMMIAGRHQVCRSVGARVARHW